MDKSFTANDCRITLQKHGSSSYKKMSFPIHCGIFSEVETRDFVFHFNLSNEIIRAKGKSREWRHPHEWLKRTAGNDWVYYSTGGYTGVFEATGEYYLPNFRYPTNNLLGGDPYKNVAEIERLTSSWHEQLILLQNRISNPPVEIKKFFKEAAYNTPQRLIYKAQSLYKIIGGQISVLPPDARHVEYNLIPLTISEGCLYNCKFCKVKNGTVFYEKNHTEIQNQISLLKSLYGRDLQSQNSLFLGGHDGLLTKPQRINFSLEEAYKEFDFNNSYLEGCNVFLFGSVTSLLGAPEQLFQDMEKFPAMIYINVGLESADQHTLDKIGKPISAQQVCEAFDRIQDINKRYSSLEITANFIMDDDLPVKHYPKILELIRDKQTFTKPKGTIYFSPLTFGKPSRARFFEFNRLKILSKFPTYLYIIQRL